MRRLMTALTTVLATAGLVAVPAATAHAGTTLLACGGSWYGSGDFYCTYVATSTHGRLTLVSDIPYDAQVMVNCEVSGSGGWVGQTGSIDYNQIPGELCDVEFILLSEDVSASYTAGSVL
ncbi:MAG: hypothetical protein QOE45_2735 [Frankiaceae bacterium]|jgi:hypothetical protein|nr:hypothetical protein [Frankiaceae bacterium]